MAITLDPDLETLLLERSQAEGLTVTAYVKRLVDGDHHADSELEVLALEGLNSGDPIEAGPGYWEEKHRSLAFGDLLSKTSTRF